MVTLLRGPFEEGSMLVVAGEDERLRQVAPFDFLLGESESGEASGKPESVKASSDRRLSLWLESSRGRFLSCCKLDASRESLRVLEDSVIGL